MTAMHLQQWIQHPELLNEDAFENWICKVKISDEAELKNLMDAEAYKAICE